MSDPFDAFESALSGETNIENLQDAKSDDPAADFLAREQVELAKIENDNFDTFGDFGSDNFEVKKEPTDNFEMNDQFGMNVSQMIFYI